MMLSLAAVVVWLAIVVADDDFCGDNSLAECERDECRPRVD